MYAVLVIPDYSLQAALRHEPGGTMDGPAALVDAGRASPVLVAVNPAGLAVGVVPGLTPPQALARHPGVVIRRRSAERDASMTAAVVQLLLTFSPLVEVTAPGVFTLGLQGLAGLASGSGISMSRWGEGLRGEVELLGVRARVGLGGTPGVARHAARWGPGVLWVEEPRSFMAGLPIAALEPSEDAAVILRGWGVGTVGELLALGQEPVVDRMGLEALGLFAAAMPTGVRPLEPACVPEPYEDRWDFEEPVETQEPLLFLLRRFVDQLARRLERAGLVAGAMTLRLRMEDGGGIESRLGIPAPTRDPGILFRMLGTHLEQVRTPSPMVAVGLSLEPAQPRDRQLGLFETALKDPQRFHETLARLSALVGHDRVGSPVRDNSHRPDAFHLVTPDFENAPRVDPRSPAMLMPGPPFRRFRPGLPAEVVTAGEPRDGKPGMEGTVGDGRPVRLRCSLVHGRIRIAVGPCRSSGHWWDPAAWRREEWDVVMQDGQVLRLVRVETGWCVEARLE